MQPFQRVFPIDFIPPHPNPLPTSALPDGQKFPLYYIPNQVFLHIIELKGAAALNADTLSTLLLQTEGNKSLLENLLLTPANVRGVAIDSFQRATPRTGNVVMIEAHRAIWKTITHYSERKGFPENPDTRMTIFHQYLQGIGYKDAEVRAQLHVIRPNQATIDFAELHACLHRWLTQEFNIYSQIMTAQGVTVDTILRQWQKIYYERGGLEGTTWLFPLPPPVVTVRVDIDPEWIPDNPNRYDNVTAIAENFYRARNARENNASADGFPLESDQDQVHYLLRAIEPNWMVGGKSGANLPCNSPGSLPRRPLPNDPRLQGEQNLSAIGSTVPQPAPVANRPTIRVYVLDTHLLQHVLNLGETELKKHLPWWRPLAAKGKLRIVKLQVGNPAIFPDTQVHVTKQEKDDLDGVKPDGLKTVPIDFSNHGAFVIDVLYRQIQGSARDDVEIVWVQTLNEFGSGHIEILKRVFAWVAHDMKKTPAIYNVVNMSFSVSVWRFGGGVFSNIEAFRAAYDMFWTYMTQVNDAVNGNVTLFAAAGNDAKADWSKIGGAVQVFSRILRQFPTIPAILPYVRGVSALEHGTSTTGQVVKVVANYSNRADLRIPWYLKWLGEVGIAAYGGGIDMKDWETQRDTYLIHNTPVPNNIALLPYVESGDGVLGPYFGKVRDRKNNAVSGEGPVKPTDCKWVEWSGTSFACPVVAGKFVAQLLAGKDSEAAFEAIKGKVRRQGLWVDDEIDGEFVLG